MRTALLAGAAVALIAGGAAFAQAAGSTASPRATMPPATVKPPAASTPAPATRSDPAPAARTGTGSEASSTGAVNSIASSSLKVGAAVKDSTGAEIGTISQVTPEGVVLQVGAQTVTVPQSSLTTQGGSVISSKSKADLTAKSPG